jgi:hypothetical protein
MGDEKFNPVAAGNMPLKSAADFKDSGVLDERHDHDRSVSATPDADIVHPGDAAVGAEVDVIDIPNREEMDHLTKLVGGANAFPAAAQAFKEVMALVGVGPDNYAELVDGMTFEEEHQNIVEAIAEWRETLADPNQARARLNALWSHPDKEPMKSYILGRSSPAVNEAITKLMQAAHGEKPVGRQKSRGDGHVY